MGRIAKNYIYNLAYQIFILIVPLATAPYLTRVLGANNMGTYSYINSYASIISTLSLLGIYNYGVRQLAYIRDNRKRFNAAFWEIIILRIILAVIGTLTYFSLANKSYKGLLILYYPWIIASYIDLSWVFVAVEDMKPTVLKNFLAKIISVVGIFIFVKTRNDVWIYILLLSASTLLANISLFPQLKKYIGKPKVKLLNLKNHITGTILLFLPQVASLLYLQIDKIMIEGMTGALNEISFYDQAEKIVKIPMTFITVASTVMLPRLANEFSKGNRKTIEKYIINISNYTLAFSFPMAVGIMAIAKQFVPWYLGTEYIPTATAIIIIAPLIISNTLAGISGSQYFVATNKMKIVIFSNVVAAILNILLNAVLIPKYGYIGAAMASVISSYSIVIMQYIRLNKDIKISKILKNMPRYFANSVVMAGVIFLCTYKAPEKIYVTFIQILIGFVVYLTLMILEKDSIIVEVKKKIKEKRRAL